MSRMSGLIPNPAAATAAADVAANNQLLSDSVGTIGRIGLGAAGFGASMRLLQEVLAANRVQKKRKDLNLVSLPMPMKSAQKATAPVPGPVVAPGLNPLGSQLYRDPTAPTEPARWLGHRANDFMEIPWAIPAAGVAIGVGGLGAYSALDKLLNARRKRDLKDEVDEAKGEFEEALVGGTPGQMKTAALQELSLRYEAAVTEEPTKKAEWLGTAQGLYAGGVLAALGLGGMYGWQQAAKSDPTRVRAELARRRAARRLAGEPVEVELVPPEMPVKTADWLGLNDKPADWLGLSNTPKPAPGDVGLASVSKPLSSTPSPSGLDSAVSGVKDFWNKHHTGIAVGAGGIAALSLLGDWRRRQEEKKRREQTATTQI